MITIPAEKKREDITRAFDEACDAVKDGHPDIAERILDRALPKPQSRHVLESIIAVTVPTK